MEHSLYQKENWLYQIYGDNFSDIFSKPIEEVDFRNEENLSIKVDNSIETIDELS